MSIATFGYSQNPNVFIDAFDVDQSVLKNGKIEYFDSQSDTSINFGVMIGRNAGLVGGPTQVLALAVFDNYGTEYNASDTIALTQSDFTVFNGTATEFINKQFKLLGGKKEGTLKFKYKFRINGGGYDDWTNWFYANKTYQTKKYEPPMPASIITGPNQICDEETYTITNPGTISLENATGIATLTDLGNNQWKVTKTGAYSGEIKIVSTVGTQKYTKSIIVGTKPPEISGRTIVTSGNTYYYNVVKSDPNSTLSINAHAGPGQPYTVSVSNNTITLTTLSLGAGSFDYNINFSATETNSCGTSALSVLNVTFRGNGNGGGGGGDHPIN